METAVFPHHQPLPMTPLSFEPYHPKPSRESGQAKLDLHHQNLAIMILFAVCSHENLQFK